MLMLNTAQKFAKYGKPGPENLVTIALPYPMRIAWDLKVSVTKIQCHRLISHQLNDVFQELLNVYGYKKLLALGIDIFGGCYNYRKMRGGNQWSSHAWAIAIDLDPTRNGLKTKNQNSQFAKPEYKQMIEVFYKNGFCNQGIEQGFDSMHFEIKE